MPQIEIQLLAVIVAVALTIPGVFLILIKMSMISDAITHTILLGIVIGFIWVEDLNSPYLILGATAVGVLTVYLVELLKRSALMSEDSAIGTVFPLLFSIAIILISQFANDVHLDIDSVLLGELAFAPFHRLVIFGYDIGPMGIFVMGGVLLLNLLFVSLCFKELKLMSFDPHLAAVLGFYPVVLQYALMTSVSITSVAAFESVGSILVIAFMIGPPMTAYLLTEDLKKMLMISMGIGAGCALAGYRIAEALDVSIAGSIAVTIGAAFTMVFIFSPDKGLLTKVKIRRNQRLEFSKQYVLFHILQHEYSATAEQENGIETIYRHLNWKKEVLERVVKTLVKEKYLYESSGMYVLSEEGRTYAIERYETTIGMLKKM